jgi:HlyD family secretion protein
MANGKSNKKKKIIIFGGGGALVLVIILLLAFSGNKEEIVQVQTESVQRRNITQIVSATGKIEPQTKVVITPEVTGEIVELPVKEGQVVKKGQLLIKIKPDSYMAAKEKAAAALNQAKSQLSTSKAKLEKIKSDYTRAQEMYNKKLSSQAELEAAKADFLSSQGEFESQQSYVHQCQASLKEANESLYKTTIYAPMDGTVSQLNVKLGERVLGSGFSQGTDIMTVADLSKIDATVEVDENDVVNVSIGDTATIEVDAFTKKQFKGVVYQIGNTAKTTAAGTQNEVVNFEIKIALIDADKEIRPGMSCNADIQTETKINVFAVPIQSVTARSQEVKATTTNSKNDEDVQKSEEKSSKSKTKSVQEIVFIVKDQKAKMVNVKTGISDDSYIEIAEGLNGNEKIISGPYAAISRDLKEGSKLKLDGKKK